MNTLDLAQQRVQLRKVSSTAGGEWQGPCPACGGTDRFHVWPTQCDGKGAYWCRSCGKWGDNIQFLRDFDGLSFREACSRLHIDAPDAASYQTRPPRRDKPEFVPASPISPDDLWQEKAEKFIAWAAENLSKNTGHLAWLSERGISAETAVRFRLGWNPGENDKDLYRPRKVWGLPEQLRDDGRPKALWIPRGLVIPYTTGGIIQRIRIRRPDGEPRYYVLPGSSMSTMLIEPERRAFVVVESELDGIAVAAGNALAGAVALGSASTKPDTVSFRALNGAIKILNALDYDAAGAKAMAWWTEQFRHCSRWPVTVGKDPGEAIKLGMAVEQWIWAGLPPALTIGSRGPVAHRDLEVRNAEPEIRHADPPPDFSPALVELLGLLRKNSGVKIINTPGRYAVLRDGKYVGGRINELVYHVPEVLDYISGHPAAEIDGNNFSFKQE